MKIRDKNPILKELITKLEKTGEPKWKAVAKGLNRPRRKRYLVSLSRIQRFAKPDENVVVPGVVTGMGEIGKPFTIAALKFTEDARKKIEAAKGKCLSIPEMVESKPKKIRIMG